MLRFENRRQMVFLGGVRLKPDLLDERSTACGLAGVGYPGVGDLLGCVLLQHGAAGARRASARVVQAGAHSFIESASRGDRGETSYACNRYRDRTRAGVRSALGGFLIDSSSTIVASSAQAR
jgi:hypothetical protein